MVRVAAERVADLFALAEKEAAAGPAPLADRYVALARRIGMRYNLRLLPEYSEVFCRGCSTYWVEGKTVRTRLRGGHRVRTCLACGRERRMPFRRSGRRAENGPGNPRRGSPQPEIALLGIAVPSGSEEEEGLDRAER